MTNHTRTTQPRTGLILATICLAVLIINIDNTILNVALPTLVEKLGASSNQLQWIVDAYSLIFGGLLLLCGSLADRFGRKPFFLSGMTIFALASIGAGCASDANAIIAWRAVMGIGGAMLLPASLSIIVNTFTDTGRRARAIGLWSAMAGLGVAAGPITGGLILEHWSWHEIFFVNVPIALIAIITGLRYLPNSRTNQAKRPDVVGALLSVAGIGLLLWSIIQAPSDGWLAPHIIGTGLGSLVILSLFVLWESRISQPMLPLSFFRNRHFSAAFVANLFLSFSLIGVLFLQTQLLQFYLGYKPLIAGLLILPVALMISISAALSPLATKRFGLRGVISFGLLAIALGLLQTITVPQDSVTYLGFLPGLVLLGVGSGLAMPTITRGLISAVPQHEAGVGSATNTMSFQIGTALGVAILGSIASQRYQHNLSESLASYPIPEPVIDTINSSLGGAIGVAAKISEPLTTMLTDAAKAAFVDGLYAAVAVGSAVAVIGALIVFCWMPKQR